MTLPPPHIFSVDLEEYFQVLAFERAVPRSAWESMPSRVDASLNRLLDLLARFDAVATFFTVGWLAERKPELVRRVVEQGHEIASHSWWHRRVTALSPAELREDVRRCRTTLEQTAGRPVLGFRAPSFSIVPGTEWAFDVLLEEGYRYDSSIFPIHRPGYGYPGAPAVPALSCRVKGFEGMEVTKIAFEIKYNLGEALTSAPSAPATAEPRK